MKLIDTIIEHITEYTESGLKKMVYNVLHHHGFVKVKSHWDMEWYSNMDEKYNLNVIINNFSMGNGSVLTGRIFYRGPSKDDPNKIVKIGFPNNQKQPDTDNIGISHPIHPNDKAFLNNLDYALRYVKSVKNNTKMEPYSDDSFQSTHNNMWKYTEEI